MFGTSHFFAEISIIGLELRDCSAFAAYFFIDTLDAVDRMGFTERMSR